jgi:hypothetical protein
LDKEKLKRNRILVQRPKTTGRKLADADEPCVHRNRGHPSEKLKQHEQTKKFGPPAPSSAHEEKTEDWWRVNEEEAVETNVEE